jgi:hypothetical protein
MWKGRRVGLKGTIRRQEGEGFSRRRDDRIEKEE